jgi:hypothetical protein
VPGVVLAAPALCGWVDAHQAQLFGAWQVGLELLLLNAALTMAGLWLACICRGATSASGSTPPGRSPRRT